MLCSNRLLIKIHAHVVRVIPGFAGATHQALKRLRGERPVAQGRYAGDGGRVLGDGEVQMILRRGDPVVDVRLVRIVQRDLGAVERLGGVAHRRNRLLVGSVCR